MPDEVAADRAAQLELIAGSRLFDQVRRHLAVVDPLDSQLEVRVLWSGRDRVRALGLIAVLGGQADVDVLAGKVTRPAGNIEDERPRVRGLLMHVADRRDAPAEAWRGRRQSFQ